MGSATSQVPNSAMCKRVEVGSSAQQGRRDYMEDKLVVDSECGLGDGLFAVFDGHNGDECAEFLQKNYVNTLIEQDCWRSGSRESVETALRKTAAKLDAEFLEHARKTGLYAGSTGVVALCKGGSLWVSNTGDSRCIAIINGRPWALSIDQKPDDPLEKKRIEELGGSVVNGRIEGQLAMARAFGDVELKDLNYLISEPEVTKTTIHNDLQFLVIASDGLWDVMSSKQVSKFIKMNSKFLSPAQLADGLSQEAHERGSTDNISVIVIKFNHKVKPRRTMMRPSETAATPVHAR